MKKYTKEQLNNMLLGEVKEIAKNEFKLALSEKGKRFTKSQLISKIMGICMVSDVMEEIKAEERNQKETIQHTVTRPLGNFTKVETMAKDSLNILVKAKDKKELTKAVETVKSVLSHWKKQASLQGRNMYQMRKIEKQVKLLTITANPYAKKVGIKL